LITGEAEMEPVAVKPVAKKTQIDLALTRKVWIWGSVAEAVRRELENSWWGSGRARGGQFHGGWIIGG